MIHDHAAVAVVLAAAGLLLLVFRRDRAAGPVHVTAASPARSLGVLLAGAGLAAFGYARMHQPPAPARAVHAPVPQPQVVTRTVIQQVTRYVPLHNWPVSGAELTLLGLAVIVAAVLIVRLAGRYFGR